MTKTFLKIYVSEFILLFCCNLNLRWRKAHGTLKFFIFQISCVLTDFVQKKDQLIFDILLPIAT